MVLFVAGLLCCLLFVYHLRKEPRRILCGILLVAAVYLLIKGGLELYAPNIYSGDDLLIGEGEEIMLLLQFFLLFLSFFGGIALCFNGVRVIRREGLSAAHVLPVGFGLIGIALPVSIAFTTWVLVKESSYSVLLLGVFPVLLNMILYVPWMLAAFLLYSLVYAALPKPKNCDFLLVLGCGLRKDGTVTKLLAGRLDRAIKEWTRGGRQAVFVVSGGKGSDEKVSEAFAMRQYLLGQGIPEAQILLEDQSVNTYENMQFSKKLMEATNPDYTCLVVTSNYHVLRAVILAKKVGLKAQGVGGRTAFYYLPAAFIREYIAIIFDYKSLVVLYLFGVLCLALYNTMNN
ncbi:MAG: YdcF family protein [Oscillospiraceae bacterium]|jgi:uncharacterized SAM-binding protein YcdF (DUF218 family)|nr:YdcF family protein [Oscillospiraceae bacterium]